MTINFSVGIYKLINKMNLCLNVIKTYNLRGYFESLDKYFRLY